MNLEEIFLRCLTASYITVEGNIDYATERQGDTLYIYFESSDGRHDWRANLDFPAKAYHRMGRIAWFAHRGFLRIWKMAEPYIKERILDKTIKKIVTVGYSHGAAIAVLCHEYIWFHRPELRDVIEGYGFGCPRVLWGILSKKVRSRWERFLVVRNMNDIITHLPPAILGYSHVGTILQVGEKHRYSAIDAHRKENITKELHKWEDSKRA